MIPDYSHMFFSNYSQGNDWNSGKSFSSIPSAWKSNAHAQNFKRKKRNYSEQAKSLVGVVDQCDKDVKRGAICGELEYEHNDIQRYPCNFEINPKPSSRASTHQGLKHSKNVKKVDLKVI